MATTPRGLPYPLPTDQVSQGAADIQALAEAVGQSFGQIPALVASGALRAPTFAGELAWITLAAADWGSTADLVAFAVGTPGVGWNLIGGADLSKGAAGDFATTAGAQTDDPAVGFTLPRPVQGWAELTVQAEVETDVQIRDAASGWYLSAQGMTAPSMSLIRPAGPLTGYLRPTYFTGPSSHIVRLRSLVLHVQTIGA